jgi:hypothetical protein
MVCAGFTARTPPVLFIKIILFQRTQKIFLKLLWVAKVAKLPGANHT